MTLGEENILNKYHMFSAAKAGQQLRFQYIWTRCSVCTNKCHSKSLTSTPRPMHSDRTPEQSELLQWQKVEYIMISIGETKRLQNCHFWLLRGNKHNKHKSNCLKRKGKKVKNEIKFMGKWLEACDPHTKCYACVCFISMRQVVPATQRKDLILNISQRRTKEIKRFI